MRRSLTYSTTFQYNHYYSYRSRVHRIPYYDKTFRESYIRGNYVKRFVAENTERLRLIRLPGYCPELNPDELLNQDVKTNALGKSRPTSKAEMIGTVRRHLHRQQKEPHVIRNLFKEKHVRYTT
ncbi:transposase [Paraburkholderia madseniana]